MVVQLRLVTAVVLETLDVAWATAVMVVETVLIQDKEVLREILPSLLAQALVVTAADSE
jgi:hypothetical protein